MDKPKIDTQFKDTRMRRRIKRYIMTNLDVEEKNKFAFLKYTYPSQRCVEGERKSNVFFLQYPFRQMSSKIHNSFSFYEFYLLLEIHFDPFSVKFSFFSYTREALLSGEEELLGGEGMNVFLK
eukprot:GDKH01020566.1.p1 GENE.GDKH01020566.1~~GDKH01020566.1.p1  ORF type:complete len:131 (+),score=4.25 GDKH01020566.1:26-394(+)